MGTENDCCLTQLVDGDGVFNVTGLEEFIKQVNPSKCGLSYAVVSIMGPQSSGKSSLLNHLFRTNFKEMDAYKGRSQTTKGIWLARGAGIEPCMLVMDLEGTDGSERGEGDTAFEKQSALFALALSDTVMINIWCHDIGREQAANRPLLKTVFQVMMRLFSPRKMTLMFVIRDKSKTPLDMLEKSLRSDVERIWDSVQKPQAHERTPLSEFFNIEVVALSSYEEKEEKFKEEVADLRKRFFHSIGHDGLAGRREGVVPLSGLSVIAQHIWKVIKENKDLDLPAIHVMVAAVRCEEIAKEMYSSFAENEEWLQLEKDAQSGVVPGGFGEKLSRRIGAVLSRYDSETMYFDVGVKSAKKAQLVEKMLQCLDKFKEVLDEAINGREGFSANARNLSEQSMNMFDKGCADAIIKQANWDTSKARQDLQHGIDSHIASVRDAKVSECTEEYEAKFTEALSGPLETLFDGANETTWPSIRQVFRRETEKVVPRFSKALSGFDLDEQSKQTMLVDLRDYARGFVAAKAKKEAERVLILMKERFSTLFSHDAESMPRAWTGNEDINTIVKIARSACLELLSVMVAIRLDIEVDTIKNTLSVALLQSPSSGTGPNQPSIATIDPLASNTWDEIPLTETLITPVQCKALWKQFITETDHTIHLAVLAQANHAQGIPAQEPNRGWRDNLWILQPAVSALSVVFIGYDILGAPP